MWSLIALAESRSAFHAQFFSEIDAGIRRLQFDEAEPLSLLGRDLQLMDDAELEHFLAVTRIIERGHIGLQETLCDAVLDALLAHPQVSAARVSTRKPDVYDDCDSVGVETFRRKPTQP